MGLVSWEGWGGIAGAGADGVFGSGCGISRFFPVHMGFPRSFSWPPVFARGAERFNTVERARKPWQAEIGFCFTPSPDGAPGRVASMKNSR
jgi:hypothetical protein